MSDLSPEAAAYAERAQQATADFYRTRELHLEQARMETALTIASAAAMLPHILLAFRDTPEKQAARRAELLEATYGREAA